MKNKNDARELTKTLKLKSMTCLNLFEVLNSQEMFELGISEVAKGIRNEENILNLIEKTEGYQITMTRYFDGLRFGNYDCVVFFSFTDVPKFMEYMPDVSHRLLLLADDDYYMVRNNITSDHLTNSNLMKVVMRIMEKQKKPEANNSCKRFYSGYYEDGLLDTYTIAK